jgi:hypothetical protein
LLLREQEKYRRRKIRGRHNVASQRATRASEK